MTSGENASRPVKVIENAWIPLPDGTRLAARIWMPDDADRRPVPAVIEYIPYRKRDTTRERDAAMHPYFAAMGYAALRIDLRGTGESDGLLLDEYLQQEQQDGVDAIRWVAGQPWCSGQVGMLGKSWGGFNALQVASQRPPALKAVITVCSADDRYADDAHYMGGCLLNENLIWGSVLFTINAQPPDPALVGERWRRIWTDRLENNPLFPTIWLRHQHRDAYWKQGSVCEDYSRIACPVYAIGGWADGYSNAVPRLMAGLRSPRKGLVGPWGHVYPHEGVPGPAIGFLQEAVTWWDHWLKGKRTAIVDEPAYRVWMQKGVPPRSFYEHRSGRWVAEETWPSPRIRPRRFFLGPRGLSGESGAETVLRIRSPLTTGLAAGSWCGFGVEGEMPTDQREDDGKSLVFDSAPLDQPFEILGAPSLRAHVSADRPVGFLAVRLCDVSPDGASTRVTYGLLNLTHRNGHEAPEPLTPGKRYEVFVRLNDVAHVFSRGHRVRLAVSTSYWPMAWPSPEPVTISLHCGESSLLLPVRPDRQDDALLRTFPPPPGGEADPPGALEEEVARIVRRDPARREVTYTIRTDLDDDGEPLMERIPEIDLDSGHGVLEEFRIREDDPLSARGEIRHVIRARRGSWSTGIRTRTVLSCTKRTFRLDAELRASEGDREIFRRTWKESIDRNLV